MVIQDIKRILLIRLKGIGDVVFTLPAVNVVRENFPEARISFLTRKENAQLLEGFRAIDEVIPLDRSIYRLKNPARIVRETFLMLLSLRRKRFSLAIDFHGLGETALLSWITAARERWGVLYGPREYLRAWAYTRGIPRDWEVHPAEWNLRMLELCGLKNGPVRNTWDLPETALEEARAFLRRENLAAGRPTLFIQPFSTSLKKNWPLEKQLSLARHWRARGVQVLFGGSPDERAALEPVRAAGFPVASGTPLLVTAALMNLSTVILGGDTGLLHLAVAMNKRVVLLLRCPTRKTYPFQHPDWAVSTHAGDAVAIELDAVVRACETAFAQANSPPVDSCAL